MFGMMLEVGEVHIPRACLCRFSLHVVVHSGKLTWNPKGGPLKRTIIFKGTLFRFHIGFPECE